MPIINPPAYLHNVATISAQIDRLANGAGIAAAASGMTFMDGVRGFDDYKVTANTTPDMTVNVAAGIAFVRGSQSLTQGLYVVPNDGTVNLAISAANATNPRIDLIIVRVQDSQYSGTANTATLEVLTGTAQAEPVDPATPPNSLIVGRITVGAAVTTITAGAVADARKWAAALGGTVMTLNGATRDALPKYDGLTVYRLDTHVRETWNDATSTWGGTASESGSTGITASTGWSLNSQSWVKKNGMCTFVAILKRTGAAITVNSAGNITPNVQVATLPSGMRPPIITPASSSAQGRLWGYVVDTDGSVKLSTGTPSVNLAKDDTISVAGTIIL